MFLIRAGAAEVRFDGNFGCGDDDGGGGAPTSVLVETLGVGAYVGEFAVLPASNPTETHPKPPEARRLQNQRLACSSRIAALDFGFWV